MTGFAKGEKDTEEVGVVIHFVNDFLRIFVDDATWRTSWCSESLCLRIEERSFPCRYELFEIILSFEGDLFVRTLRFEGEDGKVPTACVSRGKNIFLLLILTQTARLA